MRSRVGPRLVIARLDEPLGRGAEDLDLVDGLAGTHVAQLRWAARGEHDQGNSGLVCLDHGRHQIGRRRTGSRGDGNRLATCLRDAQGHETGGALVDD